MFGLLLASRAVLPASPITSVAEIPPEALDRPSGAERALAVVATSENLFWALATLLAVVLIARLGWWGEAGFNGPSHWRNLRLLLFPLLVGASGLVGGVRSLEPALFVPALLSMLVAAFGTEAIYRGLLWRALAPKTGVTRLVVTTSLLYGALNLGRLASAGPWPEAVYLTVLATCSGFTYAALRWPTASIWPVILLHFVFDLSGEIAAPGSVPYLRPLLALATPLVLLAYGLFLLRNPRVRSDEG